MDVSMTRLTTVAAVVLLSVTFLTACDPGGPVPEPTSPPVSESATPTPTSTPTPTADPSAIADFIVVNGSGVGVGAINSFSIVQIPYTTDGATAAGLLSDAIGVEPAISTVPSTGGSCSRDATIYDWGGLAFRVPGAITTPGGQQFNAIVSAPETTGGLDLETAHGQRVGSLVDDFMGIVPGADLQDLGGGYVFIYFDRQNPSESEADAWGAIAKVESGAVARIDAPLYYYGDC